MSARRREEVLALLKEKRVKFATVSGVLTTRPDLIEWVDRTIPEIEIITTKSYQVRPNPGNREPILVEEASGCYGNAVGLQNPGMELGYRELSALRRRRPLRGLLNISLSANSIEDFISLVRRFEDLGDILELNLSCPHAGDGYGAAIGKEVSRVEEYIGAIRRATRATLFAKLTPNVDRIGPIAQAALRAGADGIAAINTVGPVTFLEPVTGKPVLYNPNGHRGGKSGEWIKEIARRKVREIRGSVGREAPIIGMGGISTASDVLAMREAGADAVGIGSVLARIPRQDLIPGYLGALKRDCEKGSTGAGDYLASDRLMEYAPYSISEIETISPDLKLFRLRGRMDYRAGQYAFIFIPGVGEKPFSIVNREPLTFIIRRRGIFTREALALEIGDTLLIRGPYGAEAPEARKETVWVVAGGTGIAGVPGLVAKLKAQGKRVEVFFGASRPEEADLQQVLDPSITCWAVVDRGRRGRVLEVLQSRLGQEPPREICFYNQGPEGFLKTAAGIEEEMGADSEQIFLSLETRCMCGIGVCGSCECGGRLLCKEGTFLPLAFLQAHPSTREAWLDPTGRCFPAERETLPALQPEPTGSKAAARP